MKNNQLIKKLKYYNFKTIKSINEYYLLVGLIDEIDKEYYENGNICYEKPYKNGSRNGLCKEYYLNGNIWYEVEYKDGLRNGLFKRYWNNGNIYQEIEYKDGLINGLYKEYNKDNELIIYKIYKDNEPIFEIMDLDLLNNKQKLKNILLEFINNELT